MNREKYYIILSTLIPSCHKPSTVIRPKRIYNFCLLHASFGWYCYVFCTLSYLFQHIWTNLLTQCIQCQFLSADVCELQVYTHIYSAQKFHRKYIKNQRFRRLQTPEGEPEGGHPHPGCHLARPRGEVALPGRLDEWDLPWCPPLPYFYPVEETLIPEPFSPEAIPISVAIANKFQGTIIPVSAPCRGG